ncbi:MAG: LysR family transcriptional regulator [Scandinavium sp.]|uniref:LysR family transcriptional regulator n=1 Tax=Scandinavium sp. TaxID=2830653 RepID=UPI003F2C2687
MHTVDLKVLHVVHVILTSGSVTKAAEILNLTPGSVTYWLNKAREATGSALFFRNKNGMQPDNVAKELSVRYQKFATQFQEDNKKLPLDDRTITLSTYALFELFLGLSVHEHSPSKNIVFTPLPTDSCERLTKLRNKEVDLDIGSTLPEDRSIIRTRVLNSPIRAIVRKDHPSIKERLTLDHWSENQHIAWSRESQLTCDDHHEATQYYELLQKRNFVCTSSNSSNMIMMACHTDSIVLMPDFIAKIFQKKMPIAIFDLPLPFELHYEFSAHYHCSMIKNKCVEAMLEKIHGMLDVNHL